MNPLPNVISCLRIVLASAIAALAALEETTILLKSKTYDVDEPRIFAAGNKNS